MAVIQYTKTYFREPLPISEDTYYRIRAQLISNPDIDLDPNPETFSKHFKGKLMTIGISFLLALLFLSISENGTLMFGIGGISFVIFIVSPWGLLLEGPSYATYIKKKKEYFERMKYAINNTTSYREFRTLFY